MNEELALNVIIHYLRSKPAFEYPSFGYDIYLPGIMSYYVSKHEKKRDHEIQIRVKEISSMFYSAAWELCRRGILRPGIRTWGEQDTPEGSAGNGYSITPFGKKWIEESDKDDFVPTEPGRFAEMLEPFKSKMGLGFYERAQQAVRCYGAHAYLACCAMCGAATESILLALALKKGDEEEMLKTYRSASGRSRIENLVIGKSNEQLQREFRGLATLLKYWRDEASHGRPSGIKDNEAYTSLALLLRFANLVNDNWKELTKN